MNNTLVIGATSAIAQATAKRFAERGDTLYLLARDQERLEVLAKDLTLRGARAVHVGFFEATDFSAHEACLEQVFLTLGQVDLALVAHGALGDQKSSEQDFEKTKQIFETNALGVMSVLTHLAPRFERQKKGTLAVISSVAGDRGRQSNYVYGAAKAAVNVFLEGLRNRLHKRGVHVLTIKPGFVDTPMTADFKKGFLWATPETIARGIEKSLNHHKDVVYLPGFWSWIMRIIRHVPESVSKKMNW